MEKDPAKNNDEQWFTGKDNKQQHHYNPHQNPYQNTPPQGNFLQEANSKKILAGVLAIVLGHIGIHKFVLGYNNEGIVLLILGLIGYVTACIFIGYFILLATTVIGLVEGIIYLTKTDEYFYNTYMRNKKSWF